MQAQVNRRKVLALLALTWPVGKVLAESMSRRERMGRLQVLHWWTSRSEAAAVQVLANALMQEQVAWLDVAIPGAAGFGAGKILKNRVLTGNGPDAAQLNGVTLSEWAAMGLLQRLDMVAARGHWLDRLYPAVWRLISHQRHVIAVPLGIHRINTLFYNKALFARLGLTVPQTWAEFGLVAAKFRQAGVTALAQSSEPWQVTTLFESLLLAHGGPEYFRALFVSKDPLAYADPRLLRALLHLRALKQWMPQPLPDESWQDSVHRIGTGNAAMHIGGDWGKGELNAMGYATNDKFATLAVPETANWHLHCIDTLGMLKGDGVRRPAQEKLATLALQPVWQVRYAQAKGSIPVLAQATALAGLDPGARESARVFALGSQAHVPSLVHHMASDDAFKDGIIAEIHHFFMEDHLPVAKTRLRLAEIARAMRPLRPDAAAGQETGQAGK